MSSCELDLEAAKRDLARLRSESEALVEDLRSTNAKISTENGLLKEENKRHLQANNRACALLDRVALFVVRTGLKNETGFRGIFSASGLLRAARLTLGPLPARVEGEPTPDEEIAGAKP